MNIRRLMWRSSTVILTGSYKVDLPDITEEERAFMRRAILGMYANPLRNQLTAKGEAVKPES